jgi:nitroreductase
MMLQATEDGLGTVWICYFNPEVIKREFNLPKNIEPINILAVGYATGTAALPDRHGRERKPLDSTVFYEHYSDK